MECVNIPRGEKGYLHKSTEIGIQKIRKEIPQTTMRMKVIFPSSLFYVQYRCVWMKFLSAFRISR